MAKKSKWPKLPAYTIPLFGSARIYLAVTKEEYQQADKLMGGNGDSDLSFTSGQVSNYEDKETSDRCFLIGIFDEQLSTLVHECAHVCFYVCGDVGVPTNSSDANETYCYMLDRMFSHFAPVIAELAFAGE